MTAPQIAADPKDCAECGHLHFYGDGYFGWCPIRDCDCPQGWGYDPFYDTPEGQASRPRQWGYGRKPESAAG